MRQAKLCRGNGSKRSSDDAMGSLGQNLLSNEFSATNSFPSLWTPPKKDLPEIGRHNSCIIYDLFLFRFLSPLGLQHQVVQARVCAHTAQSRASSAITTHVSWIFQEQNVIPARETCLAHTFFCQAETPSSLAMKWWGIKSWRKMTGFLCTAQAAGDCKSGRCWWKPFAIKLETQQSVIKNTLPTDRQYILVATFAIIC